MDHNYEVRCGMYNKSMKEMFKQIPTTMTEPLISKKRPETYDRNWWWMVNGKITRGIPPLSRPKLSKKHKRRRKKLKNYMKQIGIGMIVNANYIGTTLNGLMQEVKPKVKPFSVSSIFVHK